MVRTSRVNLRATVQTNPLTSTVASLKTKIKKKSQKIRILKALLDEKEQLMAHGSEKLNGESSVSVGKIDEVFFLRFVLKKIQTKLDKADKTSKQTQSWNEHKRLMNAAASALNINDVFELC